MSRSKWKTSFQDNKLFLKTYFTPKSNVKIWSRASTISALLLNKTVFIHTGNSFKKVLITRTHVGYKFGEFAVTRSIKKKLKKRVVVKKKK